MNNLTIALIDVMTWIKNWDADFLGDGSGEWQQTEANVQFALKAAGVPDGQLRELQTYAFDPDVRSNLGQADP